MAMGLANSPCSGTYCRVRTGMTLPIPGAIWGAVFTIPYLQMHSECPS